MSNKYTKEELIQNRKNYLTSRQGDLTSYAGMIGEGFSSTIDRLAQLIGEAHEPSLGLYKERLLLKTIREFLPKQYEVGTGFVLFPCKRTLDIFDPQNIDIYNLHSHKISRQIDIIVYDCINYPVVFKDDDFVIVRPESIRSIIEVKGALDSKQINNFMDSVIDFGVKWVECNRFYESSSQPKLHVPSVFIMNFRIAVDTRGRFKANGKSLREGIVKHYKNKLINYEYKKIGFPTINAAYIYNDSIVLGIELIDNNGIRVGFSTERGHFIQYKDDGSTVLGTDKTIYDLIARIYYSLNTPFNQYFSYVDQTMRGDLYKHKYYGFTEM